MRWEQFCSHSVSPEADKLQQQCFYKKISPFSLSIVKNTFLTVMELYSRFFTVINKSRFKTIRYSTFHKSSICHWSWNSIFIIYNRNRLIYSHHDDDNDDDNWLSPIALLHTTFYSQVWSGQWSHRPQGRFTHPPFLTYFYIVHQF